HRTSCSDQLARNAEVLRLKGGPTSGKGSDQTMPNDRASFAAKVAFVTGAANGIGRAAALAFAHEGVSVAVADVSEPANQEMARLIQQTGGRVLAIRCDVSRPDDVKAALDKTVETFGR